MKKIGIIGAGNMGSGIVQKTAQEGLDVLMLDIRPEFVTRGLDTIRATLQEGVARKLFRPEQVDEIMSRIRGTTDMNELGDRDLIIEAVFEDMDVKKDLFARLDRICDPHTIFATNTSSFSVEELASATARPDRFVGLHFFYHPAKNRLLEIIPGPATSPETVAASARYAALTGKTDILVKDSPGFAVNRFFVPWLNEATRILEEGWAAVPTIDRAAMDAFGIGMGPFKLMNVTGVPIAYHSTITLGAKLGPFYGPSRRLAAQFDSDDQWALEGDPDENTLDRVSERLMSSVFYVASALLDEGMAGMEDIDLGAKVGLRWRKGPFELMNVVGISKAHDMVEQLLSAWPDVPMPERLGTQAAGGAPWDIRYVTYHRDGNLGYVTISRPDAMNAINHTVMAQLDEAFREAEADPDTKAVIIEGTGKAFVAGADIGFFVDCITDHRLQDNMAFTAYGQEVLQRIDESTKLVVAKMDGLALGGGLELALAADVIAATPKAVMGFPETGIGIYPGLGGTQRTGKYLGKELAKYLIFTGRLLSAHDALAVGLVDHVFAPDEIDEALRTRVTDGTLTPAKGRATEDLPPEWRTVRELFSDGRIGGWLSGRYAGHEDPFVARTAKIVGSKAPIALKLANDIIDEGYGMPVSEGVKLELAHLTEIFETEDALAGLKSVGKGRPVFKGR